jgi:hypothetical protein
MRQTHEPFALTNEDTETGKRLVTRMKFAKLNEAHSRGEIDGASYSNIISEWAKVLFPGDRQALGKFLKLHHEELADKIRDDYRRNQGAAGSGVGVAPSHNPHRSTSYSDSAANTDGVQSPSINPIRNKSAQPGDAAITVENLHKLANEFFSGDIVRAGSALRSRAKEIFG